MSVVEITPGTDDGLLTVTLRGKPDELVNALVNGLPYKTLLELRAALNSEIEKRGL